MHFKSLKSVALSIGVTCFSTILFSLPANALKPQCKDPKNETPLTKDRLVQIYNSIKSVNATAELAFEEFALQNVNRQRPKPRNTKRYESPAREALTGAKFVVPDGVDTVTVTRRNSSGKAIINRYPESFFIEAKALTDSSDRKSTLPPSYEKSQVIGFLDYLGNKSSAAKAGEIPVLLYITTANIEEISPDTVTLASRRKVALFHGIVCELNNTPGALRVGRAILLNPELADKKRKKRIPTTTLGASASGRLN